MSRQKKDDKKMPLEKSDKGRGKDFMVDPRFQMKRNGLILLPIHIQWLHPPMLTPSASGTRGEDSGPNLSQLCEILTDGDITDKLDSVGRNLDSGLIKLTGHRLHL